MQADAQQCADPYPATRDPSNPLGLAAAPGADPLTGARFFVDGPRHGEAAGAIAQLLGIDPDPVQGRRLMGALRGQPQHGSLHRKLAHNRRLAHKVQLFEKIADQPEAQRFSAFSCGGGPGADLRQVQKIFCHNMTADPGSIPIITTYFLHPGAATAPRRARIAAAPPDVRAPGRRDGPPGSGNRPAVYLLEVDAIGSSSCMARDGALARLESDCCAMRSTGLVAAHAVVYMEAGYSDANWSATRLASLNAVGVRKIRGFFTNDTHINWTTNEIRWAEKISSATHGAHFIVNTAENGNGPSSTPTRATQGIEDLCNPPGRGLGPRRHHRHRVPDVDALMWTHMPGNSSGNCNGGPPPGTFWPARALDRARDATQLAASGPGYASDAVTSAGCGVARWRSVPRRTAVSWHPHEVHHDSSDETRAAARSHPIRGVAAVQLRRPRDQSPLGDKAHTRPPAGRLLCSR